MSRLAEKDKIFLRRFAGAVAVGALIVAPGATLTVAGVVVAAGIGGVLLIRSVQ